MGESDLFKIQVCLWLFEGVHEKKTKWFLIKYWILLPNCLVFACETKGEFDIT